MGKLAAQERSLDLIEWKPCEQFPYDAIENKESCIIVFTIIDYQFQIKSFSTVFQLFGYPNLRYWLWVTNITQRHQ